MRPSNFKHRRQGSVLVVSAAATVALLACAALVVDYSVLLADRNRLQRACDAGALAGASYLQRTGIAETDRSAARIQAVTVARQNGLTATEVTPGRVEFLEGDTKIRVSAERIRPLFFIRVVGIYNGSVNARATAGTKPFFTPQAVPIGITPETFNTYRNDRSSQELVLCRPQISDFFQNTVVDYDPFVLTDYRTDGDASTQGSSAQMARQIAGEDKIPIKIGYSPSSLRNGEASQGEKFKDGIASLFSRATGSPWNDPQTGPSSPAWSTVGTRFDEILAGASPRSNPRVVNLFVTPGVPTQSGNFNYNVLAFAPVYIESVTDVGGLIKMRVRFLDPASSFNSQPVGLIE